MWDPAFLISFVPVLLFSLTFHEFAHAWSAYRLGDPTAAAMGRLTLNPIRHLDLFGTIVLVISGFRFGWAKPVPVNPYNFRDPKFGMFLSAAAGPAANILLAFGCGLILRWLGPPISGGGGGLGMAIYQVFFVGLMMNLSLAFFNLIPLPPLDGSKILMGLAPAQWEVPLLRLQQVGPMILIGIIAIGFIAHVPILWMFIGPPVKLFVWLFSGITLGF